MEDKEIMKKISLNDLPIAKELVERLNALHIKTLYGLIFSNVISNDEREKLRANDKRIDCIFKRKDNYIKKAIFLNELAQNVNYVSVTNLPLSKNTLISLRKNKIYRIGKLLKFKLNYDNILKSIPKRYWNETNEELLKTFNLLQFNKLYFLSNEFKQSKNLNSYSDKMMMQWLDNEGQIGKLKDYYLSNELFTKICDISVEKLPIPTAWVIKLVENNNRTIGDLFNIDAIEFDYIQYLPKTAIAKLNKIFFDLSFQGINYFFSNNYRVNQNLLTSSEQEILEWIYSDTYNYDLESENYYPGLLYALKAKAKSEKTDKELKQKEEDDYIIEHIKARYDELKDIPVEDLHLRQSVYSKLLDGDINNIGELFDFYLNKYTNKKVSFNKNSEVFKVIFELAEKGIDYINEKEDEEEQRYSDKYTRLFAKRRPNKKGFDYSVIEIINNLFDRSIIGYCKWVNLSHTGRYNAIAAKTELYGDVWTGKDLTDKDIESINKFLVYRTMNYKDKDVTGIFINNPNNIDKTQKDFVCILEYKDEVKCFFANELPEELKNKFLEAGFHWKNENEISGCCDGEILTVFKKPYFFPKNTNNFSKFANTRGMSAKEYSIFLTGFEYSRVHQTDKDFIKIIEKYSKNGKVYFPMIKELAWLRSLLSRNGYNIKEFVELFGYEYRY